MLLPKDVLLLILQKKEGLLMAVSFRSSWTRRGRALLQRLHGPHTCPGLPKLFPPPRGPTLLALPKYFPGRCPRATPQPGQGHAQRPPSTRPAARSRNAHCLCFSLGVCGLPCRLWAEDLEGAPTRRPGTGNAEAGTEVCCHLRRRCAINLVKPQQGLCLETLVASITPRVLHL